MAIKAVDKMYGKRSQDSCIRDHSSDLHSAIRRLGADGPALCGCCRKEVVVRNGDIKRPCKCNDLVAVGRKCEICTRCHDCCSCWSKGACSRREANAALKPSSI